ncbi:MULTISPECIES: APC family permease [unclassified Sporosarcina]|uniref:APC family permease n=1 Tax=unclassified Sporosarcina TaxID=2647733 RepID=UPI00203FDC5E|nr:MULTISPECIES: APC family permease [unclassified Sporosarcina]GKV63893.1 APC family permease [Sporosarcina sp. NCCP-2331]GLB54673.1 APC family permease [Sporosarcina sp. NCCP-2378]
MEKESENARRKLNKTLKPSWVFAIALGSSVGWGAFILPGDWIRDSGPLGAVIGLGIGAVIMMIIASSYGVMIKKFPVSGGGFTYAFVAAGKIWAFICGWFLSLGYISIVALNASALTLLLKFLAPGFMKQGYLYSVAGWDVYLPEVLIASAIILLFALINTTGTSVSGQIQFYFSVLLVAGVVLLGVFTYGSTDQPFTNLQPFFKGNQSILTSILVILAIAPWAYVGFDNVPQAAEEFNFSPRKATMLIVASLFTSFLIYAIMIGLTGWTFPSTAALGNGDLWLTGEVVRSSLGIAGLAVMAVAIVMGIFTGLNGFFMSSSRLLFSMARARALPNFFRTITKEKQTPVWGIWFVALITLPTPWFGRQALTWIVDMSSTGVSVAYFFTCLAAYKVLAWGKEKIGREIAPVKKFLALIGMIASGAFLALLLVPNSPAALSTPSYILLFAWGLVGIVFYLVIQKRYNSLTQEETEYYVLGKTIESEVMEATDDSDKDLPLPDATRS